LQTIEIFQMRTSALIRAKNFGFFGLYGVYAIARTKEKGVEPVQTRGGGGEFFAALWDLFYGRPLSAYFI